MKKKIAIALLVISFAALGSTEESEPILDSFRLGVGFADAQIGYGVGFDVHSPAFLTWNRAELTLKLDVVFDYSLFVASNLAIGSNGQFQDVNLNNFALGLRLSRYSANSWMTTYVQAQALYGLIDSSLTSNPSSFGAVFTLGADFFFIKNEEGLFGKHAASFFVQADVYLDTKRADRISGQPELYSTIAPRIGFRVHY